MELLPPPDLASAAQPNLDVAMVVSATSTRREVMRSTQVAEILTLDAEEVIELRQSVAQTTAQREALDTEQQRGLIRLIQAARKYMRQPEVVKSGPNRHVKTVYDQAFEAVLGNERSFINFAAKKLSQNNPAYMPVLRDAGVRGLLNAVDLFDLDLREDQKPTAYLRTRIRGEMLDTIRAERLLINRVAVDELDSEQGDIQYGQTLESQTLVDHEAPSEKTHSKSAEALEKLFEISKKLQIRRMALKPRGPLGRNIERDIAIYRWRHGSVEGMCPEELRPYIKHGGAEKGRLSHRTIAKIIGVDESRISQIVKEQHDNMTEALAYLR